MSIKVPALLLLLSISAQAQTVQPPTILEVSAPTVTQSNAWLRARFAPNSGQTVRAWFKWGKTTKVPNRLPAQAFSGATSSITFSNLVRGLATNQTYYFQCVTSNRFGIRRSATYSFRTKHDVQFQALNAASLGSTQATITATFTAHRPGRTWFRWGPSSNLLNSTAPINYVAGTNSITRSNLLTGLTPNKRYYYRAMASNQFGISGSAVSSFRAPLNFQIDWVDAHVYEYNNPVYVVIHGAVSQHWGTTSWFEWGKDTNNPSLSSAVDVQATPWHMLWGLDPNTLYYYRLVVTNIYGRDSTLWKVFRTPTGLHVTTYPAGSGNTFPTGPGYPQGIGAIGSTTARLGAWISNILPPITDAWFEWGTTTNYENRTAIVVSGAGSFEMFTNITGLQEAGAIYHYRAVASNSIGMAYGTNQTFATPLFPLALGSSNLPGVINGRALWLDYDKNGWLDILVAGETATGAVFHVWRNDGATFSRAPVEMPPVSQASFVFGDHDNDGWPDILLAAYGRLEVWRNDGLGFSNINAALPGAFLNQGNSIDWADYDNDGRIDVLVEDFLNWWGTNYGLGIWRSTPQGFDFQSLDQVLKFAAVTWIDYDNDGWNDIVFKGVIYSSWSNHTNYIWRNKGARFVPVASSFNMSQSGSLAWGDYDNNGWLDAARPGLIIGGAACDIWRNTGTDFANINAGLPPVGDESTGASALWGDYDNDGRLDLLIYGYNQDGLPRMDQEFLCQIWRNTGSGFTNINAGLPGLWNGSAAWGDYDNDGRLDVLMTGHKGPWSGQRVTHIYRNVHAPPNTPPTAPTGLQVFPMDFGLAFTWLEATDAQTPSSGLSYNLRVGSAPGQGDIISPNALPDGKRLLVQLGNAQMRRFAFLTGLTNGQTIYWSVQAIDTAFAGGPFAPEETFVYSAP